MSQTLPSHPLPAPDDPDKVTIFGPDFPFAYDSWLASAEGIGRIPTEKHGAEVAIIGAGLSGMGAAYELMNLGLRPVIYESARMGGRLRSEQFSSGDETVAELGACGSLSRRRRSSTTSTSWGWTRRPFRIR